MNITYKFHKIYSYTNTSQVSSQTFVMVHTDFRKFIRMELQNNRNILALSLLLNHSSNYLQIDKMEENSNLLVLREKLCFNYCLRSKPTEKKRRLSIKHEMVVNCCHEISGSQSRINLSKEALII